MKKMHSELAQTPSKARGKAQLRAKDSATSESRTLGANENLASVMTTT